MAACRMGGAAGVRPNHHTLLLLVVGAVVVLPLPAAALVGGPSGGCGGAGQAAPVAPAADPWGPLPLGWRRLLLLLLRGLPPNLGLAGAVGSSGDASDPV